ncbi:hypothetical protein HDU98_006703 [Podochytrium sp. JEL0797]|nr:hypothetical protein HDU98_006703 [Podochytrium sp. JEL0797]
MRTTPSSQLLFAACTGYVHAFDTRTGTLVWTSVLTGTGFNETDLVPNPFDDTLLVTSGANLRCISATTGTPLWENKLIGIGVGNPTIAQGRDAAKFKENTSVRDPHPKTPHYANSQIDSDNMVFVARNSNVRAILIDSGRDLWVRETALFARGFGGKPFLLIDQGVLYVSGNGVILALNAMSGDEVWKAEIPNRSACTLAVMTSGNPTENIPFNRHRVSASSKPDFTEAIFYGAGGYIDILYKANGMPFPMPGGEITLPGVGFSSSEMFPLHASRSILVATGINLRHYSLETGRLVWENRLTGMGNGYVLSVVVGSGVSLPVESNEGLPAYSAVESMGGSSSEKVQVDAVSRLLFVCLGGKVRAIRMQDGMEVWKYEPSFMQSCVFTNVFVEDGCVFLGGSGLVTCLDAGSGRVVWLRRKAIRHGKTFVATVRSGNGEANRTSLFGNRYDKKKRDEETKD